MQLYRDGALPTNRAPERNFTGDVQIGGYFRRSAPSRLAGASVAFTPGSRTPWKVNPLGQTLVVTSGVGWAQGEGEEIAKIQVGDIIWFEPGQRHWEGATPDHAMSYVAIQEEGYGGAVRFGEKVTDEEYRKGPPTA
jgi:quercetin dioxygenase-like cupin family protein